MTIRSSSLGGYHHMEGRGSVPPAMGKNQQARPYRVFCLLRSGWKRNTVPGLCLETGSSQEPKLVSDHSHSGHHAAGDLELVLPCVGGTLQQKINPNHSPLSRSTLWLGCPTQEQLAINLLYEPGKWLWKLNDVFYFIFQLAGGKKKNLLSCILWNSPAKGWEVAVDADFALVETAPESNRKSRCTCKIDKIPLRH